MEIRIKLAGTEGDGSGTLRTYLVTDNGKNFRIVFRSHVHETSLALEGDEGRLYTDREHDVVRRRVVAVGPACGLSIKSDEPVEGLSPWAIRGVIFAERHLETREITIRAPGKEDGSGEPVMTVDGSPVNEKLC